MTEIEYEVTNNQISLFRSNGRNYLNHIGSTQNPLSYSIQKMLKRTDKAFEDYQNEAQDIRAEFALIKDGAFVTKTIQGPQGPYQETEIDASKINPYNKKLRELNSRKVKIECRHASYLPKDLEQVWVEYFVPFVIADFIEPEPETEDKGNSNA